MSLFFGGYKGWIPFPQAIPEETINVINPANNIANGTGALIQQVVIRSIESWCIARAI